MVLLGLKAHSARDLVKALRPDVYLLEGWHPSPLAMNREPSRWQQLLDVLHAAEIERATRG